MLVAREAAALPAGMDNRPVRERSVGGLLSLDDGLRQRYDEVGILSLSYQPIRKSSR
jgi:hypothetical protein